RPEPAEITRRGDQPAAEMMVPDAVDNRPPGERILRFADPSGERRAARSFCRLRLSDEIALRKVMIQSRRYRRERTWLGWLQRKAHIAALEHMNRPALFGGPEGAV